MERKAQVGAILFILFILGIIIELYYVISFLQSELSFDQILEKTLITGILTSILIVLAILLIRQKGLMQQMGQIRVLGTGGGKRTPKQVRSELEKLYRDLGALKIVVMDNLMERRQYEQKKSSIEALIDKKKKELREIEKSGDA
jgi:hypothetical protein